MADESPDWFDPLGDTAILDVPQFARDEVLRMTGLTAAQLKNTLDRNLVRLSAHHNPGTGRRRLFTGGDVLKMEAAHALSSVGIPMRMLATFSDLILSRARNRLTGLALDEAEHNLRLILYPLPDDNYQIIWASDLKEPGPLPVAVSVLHIDLLVEQTIKKLEAVIADKPVPDFTPESRDDAGGDFFMRWDTDAEGNRVLVGLTKEETKEFESLADADSDKRNDRDRYLELHDKHETARRKRLTDTREERLSDALGRALREKEEDR